MTNPAPTTRSQAVAVAEDVTMQELVDLLNTSRAVTVFRPRSRRRLAHVVEAQLSTTTTGASYVDLVYDFTTPLGNGDAGAEMITHTTRRIDRDPVFHFYNLDRVVRLEVR